jgi:hypothetical protein
MKIIRFIFAFARVELFLKRSARPGTILAPNLLNQLEL